MHMFAYLNKMHLIGRNILIFGHLYEPVFTKDCLSSITDLHMLARGEQFFVICKSVIHHTRSILEVRNVVKMEIYKKKKIVFQYFKFK